MGFVFALFRFIHPPIPFRMLSMFDFRLTAGRKILASRSWGRGFNSSSLKWHLPPQRNNIITFNAAMDHSTWSLIVPAGWFARALCSSGNPSRSTLLCRDMKGASDTSSCLCREVSCDSGTELPSVERGEGGQMGRKLPPLIVGGVGLVCPAGL